MKKKLLVFGTKNFNNSLNEIKKYLDFSLIFFNDDTSFNDTISTINAVLVDSETCNNLNNLSLINSIHTRPILLIENDGVFKKCNYTYKINFPIVFSDFNIKIMSLISSQKFIQNSSIKVKEYIIDKNEKTLKNGILSINVTEREIQLIELLFNEKKSLSINNILKRVWKYSEGVDTHTVETHIYRLRKKILNKFKDDNFIISSKDGYLI